MGKDTHSRAEEDPIVGIPAWAQQSAPEPTEDYLGTGLPGEEVWYLGYQLLHAINERHRWCHRIVESLLLLQEGRGLRKVSCDCTPQPILWDSHDTKSVGPQARLAMVPLALLNKGAIRQFSIVDDTGQSIPVLGREHNALLAAAMLAVAMQADRGTPPASDDWLLLHEIVRSTDRKGHVTAAEAAMLFDVSHDAAGLISYFSENYLLIALLPSEAIGRRQVVKYSFHYEIKPRPVVGLKAKWRIFRSRLGLRPLKAKLALGYVLPAQCYHLEIQAPSGLTCAGVTLPDGNGGRRMDTQPSSVGHVYMNGGANFQRLTASIDFDFRVTGLLGTLTGTAVATCFLFCGICAAPGALDAWSGSPDSATALLLFGPASFLAYLARGGENALVESLSIVLKLTALFLAGILFCASTSIVGELHAPYLRIYWTSGAIVTGAVAITLLAGVDRLRRGTKGGRMGEGT